MRLAPWEASDLLKRIGDTYDLNTEAGRKRADAAMRGALEYHLLASDERSAVTRAERAGAILDRAIAELAAIGVECQASAHRETEVGAAMAGAPVLSLSLSATVYATDEVIP
jgi:C-terminal processing protease CtpA/Prc